MAITGRSEKFSGRIRLGMVGGGQGAFIGAVHRIAARLDDQYRIRRRRAIRGPGPRESIRS